MIANLPNSKNWQLLLYDVKVVYVDGVDLRLFYTMDQEVVPRRALIGCWTHIVTTLIYTKEQMAEYPEGWGPQKT